MFLGVFNEIMRSEEEQWGNVNSQRCYTPPAGPGTSQGLEVRTKAHFICQILHSLKNFRSFPCHEKWHCVPIWFFPSSKIHSFSILLLSLKVLEKGHIPFAMQDISQKIAFSFVLIFLNIFFSPIEEIIILAKAFLRCSQSNRRYIPWIHVLHQRVFLGIFCHCFYVYLRCHFLWLTHLVSRNPSLILFVMDKAIGQRELVFTLVLRKTFQKMIMGS